MSADETGYSFKMVTETFELTNETTVELNRYGGGAWYLCVIDSLTRSEIEQAVDTKTMQQFIAWLQEHTQPAPDAGDN